MHSKQDLGGKEISDTCRTVFAALLWHTQALREDLSKFVTTGGECKISEGIYQAYSTSESLRSHFVSVLTFVRLFLFFFWVAPVVVVNMLEIVFSLR